MAAAIGQAATLGRRPHCNTTSNPRSSRADQLWAWAEKVPVGAGGLLTPLEGKAPAVSRRLRLGLCLTLCLRDPSPKATDGFHHFPAPVSGRAVEHASKIGPSSCRIDPRRPAAFERDGR